MGFTNTNTKYENIYDTATELINIQLYSIITDVSNFHRRDLNKISNPRVNNNRPAGPGGLSKGFSAGFGNFSLLIFCCCNNSLTFQFKLTINHNVSPLSVWSFLTYSSDWQY